MRIRMLRQVATTMGVLRPGDITTVPDKIAIGWCKAGLAMQDKSVEPDEDKVATVKVKKSRVSEALNVS